MRFKIITENQRVGKNWNLGSDEENKKFQKNIIGEKNSM